MKTFTGTVVSTKMQKTAVVTVEHVASHPRYKKVVRRKSKIKADTAEFTVKESDIVRIGETRPISRDKHFKILEVIKGKKS